MAQQRKYPSTIKTKEATLPTGPLGEVGCRDGYGPMWAAVSNTPYRQYKIETFDGGLSLRGPLSQFRPIWTASRSTPTGIILRNFLRPRCGTSFPIPALPHYLLGTSEKPGGPDKSIQAGGPQPRPLAGVRHQGQDGTEKSGIQVPDACRTIVRAVQEMGGGKPCRMTRHGRKTGIRALNVSMGIPFRKKNSDFRFLK